MSGRNERLRDGLRPSDPIIEIGPLHSPVAPKAEGWATTVVDHATRDELVAKYTGHAGVDPARIEEVDVVWRSGPLHAAFPPETHGTFAALIASHVIEHIPDPIGFVEAAARLLRADGVIALAVPDKRWCFDLFKALSTTGQMLAAHRIGAQRHQPATRFDHNAYTALDGGRPGWGREALSAIAFCVPLEEAKAQFDAYSDAADAPYVDCHAWHFTPSSFQLIILELAGIGVADWRVEWILPQPSTEFLVQLRRGGERFPDAAAREARRLELLKQTLLELREQTDWLLPPAPPPPVEAPAAPRGLEDRLSAIEDRLIEIGGRQLPGIAARTGAIAEAVAPLRSALDTLLPLRRTIARLRGRVP
jgi:SAM-dependent methyltransferase